MKEITAIVGGKILQGNQFLSRKNLLIKNGKILGIDSKSSPRDAKKIDASGLYVVPGFIDLHLHCDVLQKGKNATQHLQEISLNHAHFGTTRFLATYCTCSLSKLKYYAHSLKLAKTQLTGAQLLGVHLEGPFLNSVKAGAQPSEFILKPSLVVAKKISSYFGNALRLMTLAPELKGIDLIIQFLTQKHVVMSMGHTHATYQEALHGISLGVRYATHLFNQMRGLHHRELGAAGAVLLDERIFSEVIADGFHLHPLMVKLITKVKNLQKIILATDCFTDLQKDDGRNPPRLPDGNLMGSALSLRRALINLIEFSSLDLPTAIQTITLNPARLLGIEDKTGSLDTGKWADIVLMDEHLNIKLTMVGGKIVNSSL